MSSGQFDTIRPVGTEVAKDVKGSGGPLRLVAVSAATALAASGVTFALLGPRAQAPAPGQAVEAQVVAQEVDGQHAAGAQEIPRITSGAADPQPADEAVTTVPGDVAASYDVPAGTTVVVQASVPDNAEPAAPPQVWVDEVGHWTYKTVIDYEERAVYEEVPNMVEYVVYYCSERDFESTDVSAVVEHCEAHGTSLRSEVRRRQEGTTKQKVGTEMVAVGSHQEIDAYVVDVEGHWEDAK